ncbi:hypothetical protein [Photobacterium leiognathi]|uniref:hypothetical protein n=1 Tax=Photobacterium leiognathi TaxID=553611 RepID=UPI000C6B13AE|nr:hypothetical protein [Photobacterium leiognathi]PHZ59836.1 hypothetical protein CRG86_007560 [Photobacterium leiognathi]
MKTRTDKLLNLLGYGCNQSNYNAIEKRIKAVESRLSALESMKQTDSSPNQQRALEVKERLFSALDELKAEVKSPLYRGKPSITKLKEVTGIDRGTISKYIRWLEKDCL